MDKNDYLSDCRNYTKQGFFSFYLLPGEVLVILQSSFWGSLLTSGHAGPSAGAGSQPCPDSVSLFASSTRLKLLRDKVWASFTSTSSGADTGQIWEHLHSALLTRAWGNVFCPGWEMQMSIARLCAAGSLHKCEQDSAWVFWQQLMNPDTSGWPFCNDTGRETGEKARQKEEVKDEGYRATSGSSSTQGLCGLSSQQDRPQSAPQIFPAMSFRVHRNWAQQGHTPVISALEYWRWRITKFKFNLSNLVRLCLKIQKGTGAEDVARCKRLHVESPVSQEKERKI